MRSSLALWYETSAPSTKYDVTLELHFNLWRDIDTGSNFFDVGILIAPPVETSADGTENPTKKTICASNVLQRFFLFIPDQLGPSQFLDLSRILLQGQTLNAVFNDVVTVVEFTDGNFCIEIGDKPRMTVHRIVVGNDIEFEPIDMGRGQVGTLLTFTRSLCARLCDVDEHYIRFRFHLDQRTHDLFTSESSPRDWFLLSSFSRTELTEFRLNERRSFPGPITARVATDSAKYFQLDTVNYFLMRDRRYELIGAHTQFRKMRRLEPDLWQHYLRSVPLGGRLARRVERALRRASDRIIIYHWKSKVDPPGKKSLDDFIAFASFRAPIPNLLVYAFVIALLGAVGAGLHPLGVILFRTVATRLGHVGQSELLENLIPVFIFFVLAFFLPIALTLVGRAWSHVSYVLGVLGNAARRGWRWASQEQADE